ncbi:hypothetical protein LTR53_003303 [Teratosphaeriaceae sp. CCFEE 6253]|nr:hypothetical protein LTR53_003303 [Teratosphaeriaceae sp. CCFEE 6253]
MDPRQPAATPDLAAILATLSQFVHPAYTTPPPVPVAEHVSASQNVTTFAPDPSTLLPPLPTAKPQDPRLRPQSRSATASPKPKIDPATITTWPEGLRCVTKLAAQNAHFAVSIRRMIDEQKKHEMRWYQERQAMKQSHATRASASAQAQSILQSLGNVVTHAPPSPEQARSAIETELAEFDRKIYAAQSAMEVAMTGELKGLGVPFFGTRSETVVPDGEDDPSSRRNLLAPTITAGELMSLRRKMVGHLEDLYRD